ncbi:MAG: reverse transcriptase N-terminal domain-containing protein [Gammaproteobacteria bacterium]
MYSISQIQIKWKNISWTNVQLYIDKFQRRIYYFSQSNNICKVRILQNMLLQSRKARLLSIYKVIRNNRCFNFAGFDLLINLKFPQYCELGLKIINTSFVTPLRPVFLTKFSKSRYSLFFHSSLADQAKQELFKIVMLPEWEAKFEISSFGFVSGRNGYDVLFLLKTWFRKSYKYVFVFNILETLDFFNYFILLAKVNLVGFFNSQLKVWINSLFLTRPNYTNLYFLLSKSRSILILMINILLNGIKFKLNIYLVRYGFFSSMLKFLRYFNYLFIVNNNFDYICLCKYIIFKFFVRLGLNLSYTNLVCCSHNNANNENDFTFYSLAFDFLGFTIRWFRRLHCFKFNDLTVSFNSNIFLYPSKLSILRHQNCLHDLILIQGKRFGQKILIGKLNLILKSWTRYFGNFDGNLTGYIVKQDYLLYLKLRRWVKRQKGSIKKGFNYWQHFGSKKWLFMTKDCKNFLKCHLHYV